MARSMLEYKDKAAWSGVMLAVVPLTNWASSMVPRVASKQGASTSMGQATPSEDGERWGARSAVQQKFP